MASSLRVSLLLLATLALAMNSVLCAKQGKSQRLVGGIMDADGDDVDVQRMLDFAVREYNKMSNDKYLHRAMTIVSARKQVVSGMNYFLKVEIGRTKCTKSQSVSSSWSSCPFHDRPDLKKKTLCLFQVYTVPWLNTTSLVKSNCQSA